MGEDFRIKQFHAPIETYIDTLKDVPQLVCMWQSDRVST